jgi:hypothetical protein
MTISVVALAMIISSLVLAMTTSLVVLVTIPLMALAVA